MFDEEAKEIVRNEFKSLKICKSALEKIFRYGELLYEMTGEPREFFGCLVKPKTQKDDLVSEIYLPFNTESTVSRVRFNPISDFIRNKELKLLGYEMLGEFHYHGIFPARPSSRDEEERSRILHSTSLIKFYPRKIIFEGIFTQTFRKDGKINLKTNSNFLDEIELHFTERKIPYLRKLYPYLNKLLKKIGLGSLSFENRMKKARFRVSLNLGICYAYNMILNNQREIYSEIIYYPICPACGPSKISFEKIKLEVVDDSKRINESELREILKERVIYAASRIQQKIRELDEKERMFIWSKYI